MLYKGFLITEHATNCYGVSNVHGVTLANFPTIEAATDAADHYGVAESSLIADESEDGLTLEELKNLPDEQIDLSDIPEIRDWSKAVRGKFYRPNEVGTSRGPKCEDCEEGIPLAGGYHVPFAGEYRKCKRAP